MWQRAGAVRLFVEHVILLNESDDDEVNSESVVTLWKVFTNASYGVINQNKRKLKQPEFISWNLVLLATKTQLHPNRT